MGGVSLTVGVGAGTQSMCIIKWFGIVLPKVVPPAGSREL